MDGFWFAVMVAFLVVAGVVVQLGWQLPERDALKQALRRRSKSDRKAPPAAVADPR